MTFYNAVKLTQIGVDNPETGYGLIETLYSKGREKKHRLDRFFEEVWSFADYFTERIDDDSEKSGYYHTSLSFKAPCDLIMRNPKSKLYKVEDFPNELQDEFSQRILEYISQYEM